MISHTFFLISVRFVYKKRQNWIRYLWPTYRLEFPDIFTNLFDTSNTKDLVQVSKLSISETSTTIKEMLDPLAQRWEYDKMPHVRGLALPGFAFCFITEGAPKNLTSA